MLYCSMLLSVHSFHVTQLAVSPLPSPSLLTRYIAKGVQVSLLPFFQSHIGGSDVKTYLTAAEPLSALRTDPHVSASRPKVLSGEAYSQQTR
jgi:hypothetical protein